MKQTAVEWLAEKYEYAYWMVKRDEISPGLAEEWKKHYLEQAKEMEKEQMKLACIRTEYEDKAWQNLMEKHFEQYYNETFKTETIVTEYRDGNIKVETFKSK